MFKLNTDMAVKPAVKELSTERLLAEVTFWRTCKGEIYQVIPYKLAPKTVFMVGLRDPKDPNMKIPDLSSYDVEAAVYILRSLGAVELDGELTLKAK